MPDNTNQNSTVKIRHQKDNFESVLVKAKRYDEVKVELEKGNIDKLYATVLKTGVNENTLKNLDGAMLAHSDLTSVEKILDTKAMENISPAGNNIESRNNSGTS